jgi:hypothetical protein
MGGYIALESVMSQVAAIGCGRADWGSVPAWVGAVGTTAAFIVALSVFMLNRLDRQRAEASKVAAWVEYDETGRAYAVCVSNGGSLPIYDVHVGLELAGIEHGPYAFQLPIVRPTSPERHPLEPPLPAAALVGARLLGASLRFRDAENRCWRRRADGVLRRTGGVLRGCCRRR